jgi:hypothetical protein
LRTAKAACCLVFLAVQQVLQLGLCLPHQRAEAIERPLASDLIQIGSEMNTIFNNLNITSPELEKQSKTATLRILTLFGMKFVNCFARLKFVPIFEAVLIGFLSTCSLAVSYYSALWRLSSHIWIYLLAD